MIIMLIVNKRGNEIKIKDIYPGETFQDFDRDIYIKIREMTIALDDGETCRINAIKLSDGDVAYFIDQETVYRVDATVVIG